VRTSKGERRLSVTVASPGRDGHDDGRRTIAVEGEVDLQTAPALEDAIMDAFQEPGVELVLDLSGVTFFASAGVSALLAARQAAGTRDGRLVLREPSPVVTRVLQLIDVLSLFEIATA
jgi:anti-anti-sigma factor